MPSKVVVTKIIPSESDGSRYSREEGVTIELSVTPELLDMSLTTETIAKEITAEFDRNQNWSFKSREKVSYLPQISKNQKL